MAKQKGIFKIQGTVGGVTFFNSDGENHAKLKSEISKERIMADAAFKLTRENMAEFGGAATAGKSFRMAFISLIRFMGGPRITGRVVKLMREIIGNGPGLRGRRSLLVTANASVIQGFEFAPDKNLGMIFNAPYTLAANAARTQVTLTVPDFSTDNFIDPPVGATHFRIVNAIGVLSDFAYNIAQKEYRPAASSLNEKYGVAYSGYIPIGGDVGASTVLVANLPAGLTMTATVGLLSAIGIEFYQEVNGAFNLMSAGNAMRIDNVF